MKQTIRLLCCLLAAAAAIGGSAEASETGWTLKSALKRIDKELKQLRGIRCEVQYAEVTASAPIEGSGEFYFNFGGKARADIGGANPRTFLVVDPYLYIHDVNKRIVRTYELFKSHHRLAKYAVVGFFPSGTVLKQRFKVTLTGEATLDGTKVLRFLLVPKKDEFEGAISKIQLWVDQATWLPAQQKIFHAGGQTSLTIRYLSVVRDDDLPASLFRPEWPEGTRIGE